MEKPGENKKKTRRKYNFWKRTIPTKHPEKLPTQTEREKTRS